MPKLCLFVYNKLSLKRERGRFMKKIARFIPLLFIPMVLSSCTLLKDALGNLVNGLNNNTSSSQNNSSSSSNSGNNSSSNSSSSPSSSSSTPAKQAEWTIMVYMCGADLESDSRGGYASKDIEEMRSTSGQPDSVNIIFETGGASRWQSGIIGGSGTKQVTANELGRYHIRDNSFIKDGKETEASMGLSTTLQSFLEWGFEKYPAKKYGVILWNHGGAMDGVCFDENYSNDSLTADEIDEAVTKARNNKGVSNKLEFLTYDACLMAIQDLAAVNAKNFKYMLSSQESEVGDGYDYDAWLPTLYANPTTVSTQTVLAKIADTFIAENGGKDSSGDQTQSVFDLTKMDAYTTAFNNFSTSLSSIINSQTKWDNFATLVSGSSVQAYAVEDGGVDCYNLADSAADIERSGKGQSVLGAMKNSSTYSSMTSQITALENAVNDVVVHETHQRGTYGCGMCIAAPIAGLIDQETYETQTPFTTWYNLCSKYGNWHTSGGGGWWY